MKTRFIKNPWVKLLMITFLVMLIFFTLRLLKVDFSKVSEEEFRGWVKSLGFWGPVIYIIVYVLRPLILFPAGVLSATAGVIWSLALGFFYLQIAANLSANVEFFIARYFARGVVEKYLKGKFLNLDEKIERHGFLTVLLVRLIPNVAWDIQNLSLGLTKVRFRDYFLATLIGIMPGSFAFVFFGFSLIRVLFNPKSFWIIGVALLLFVGVYLLQKYLRRRQTNKIETKKAKEGG